MDKLFMAAFGLFAFVIVMCLISALVDWVKGMFAG